MTPAVIAWTPLRGLPRRPARVPPRRVAPVRCRALRHEPAEPDWRHDDPCGRATAQGHSGVPRKRRRVSGRRGCSATSLQKGMARPRGVEPLTPRSQIGRLSVYNRAETQRRDRPPEAQPQQGFHPSRSSCPTNDPYNSAPSLQQLSLSRRIATSSASARAEGCARRARRGVPGFSPRDTPARLSVCFPDHRGVL